MAEGKLKNKETYSVEEFKELTSTKTLRIAKNPNTEKLFMVYGPKGEMKGAVAGDKVPANPAVSLVENETTGESFYILHEDTSIAVL